MKSETLHLLKWQFIWAKRFLLTWYHIFNRSAYRKWKAAKKKKSNFGRLDLDWSGDLFH